MINNPLAATSCICNLILPPNRPIFVRRGLQQIDCNSYHCSSEGENRPRSRKSIQDLRSSRVGFRIKGGGWGWGSTIFEFVTCRGGETQRSRESNTGGSRRAFARQSHIGNCASTCIAV